jgi:hypothetical protein
MRLALTSDNQPDKPHTASPQLPDFLPQRSTTHVPSNRRISTRDNLYLFLFFAALFAVIIAHAG